MSATGRQTISGLARGTDCVAEKTDMCESTGYGGWGFGWGLLLWIILTVIIWLILVTVNPGFLRRGKHGKGSHSSDSDSSDHGHDHCDFGRAFLAALVIGFIITIIVWAIAAAVGGYGHKRM